ncbi:conserved hypothetical protein [Deferribacter desulfuricans SSM1]|uniref:CheW-like domain-containing protein n=1 Tax=Deferribacter desulfuricans (strain DSM 14783 / JCM 11476 / NBRC 101012 / SSM1) TaxID=639282 RepID=D3PDJ2_DEFDS|nr:chemotaxis protein CheW [Deferribacter desulfuricans]BAI80665.1 conserved hypothetical protein [Deferribacter desulfuricans SSM1]
MPNIANQVVTFSIKNEIFGLNADYIDSIVRIPEYTKVPKTSKELLGISNLRGDVVPIIDLALKLGYDEPVEIGENSRAIILDYKGEKAALTVDEMKSVLNQEDYETEDLPPTMSSNVDKKYISGVLKIKQNDMLVQLLDIENMMELNYVEDSKSDGSFKHQDQKYLDESNQAQVEEEKFISFIVDDVEYAVKVQQIREILRYQEISEVPGLQDYVLGIFPLRNEIIPVISARKLFKKSCIDITEDARIVILEIKNFKIGLLVDKVNEVLSVEKSFIEDLSTLFNSSESREINGVIKLDEGKQIILILNSEKIFNEDELSDIVGKVVEKQETGEDNMEKDFNETDEIVQIVTFKVDEEYYGFPIEMVQEINRFTNVTKVPKTPKFVEGIINLRGEVIPLVDIRKRFDLEEKERDEFTRLIIVNFDDLKVGFIVDSVEEVLRINKNKIDDVPAVLSASVDTEFITNVINIDQDKMVMILDAKKMFSDDEYKKLEKIRGKEKKD